MDRSHRVAQLNWGSLPSSNHPKCCLTPVSLSPWSGPFEQWDDAIFAWGQERLIFISVRALCQRKVGLEQGVLNYCFPGWSRKNLSISLTKTVLSMLHSNLAGITSPCIAMGSCALHEQSYMLCPTFSRTKFPSCTRIRINIFLIFVLLNIRNNFICCPSLPKAECWAQTDVWVTLGSLCSQCCSQGSFLMCSYSELQVWAHRII